MQQETDHTCRICNSKFSRKEHLHRHMSSHSKEKPYKCSACFKGFSRTDILHRHQQSHVIADEEPTPEGVSRACLACAAGRVRCSRKIPCSRCTKKGVNCIYPAAQTAGTGVQQTWREHAHSPVERGSLMVGSIEPNRYQGISENCANGSLVEANSRFPLPGTDIQNGDLGRPAASAQRIQWDSTWSVPSPQLPYEMDYATDQRQIDNQSYGYAYDEPLNSQQFLDLNWMTPSNNPSNDWMNLQSTEPNNFAVYPSSETPTGFENNTSFVPERPERAPTELAMKGQRHEVMVPSNSRTPTDLTHGSPTYSVTTDSINSTGSMTSLNTQSKYPSYTDKEGGRASLQDVRAKRRKYNLSEAESSSGQYNRRPDTIANSQTPELPLNGSPLENTSPFQWVSEEIYQELLARICELDPNMSNCGTVSSFPSISEANNLCQAFFVNFHPSFPFLRKAQFPIQKNTWILVLAVMTVGSCYLDSSTFQATRRMLYDYLQGANIGEACAKGELLLPTKPFLRVPNYDLVILQACLLQVLLMLHSGNPSSMERAFSIFKTIISNAKTLKLFQPMDRTHRPGVESGEQEWIQGEERIRVAYMIWLLDFILMHEFNVPSHLELIDIQIRLPVSDVLWDNPSTENDTEEMTLSRALEIIYAEKRLIPKLGEFTHIILIYAICRQTSEISRYSRNHMSGWTPSANAQMHVEFPERGDWPPSSQIYAKWRNSACDSLDILHWSANSKIAQSGGREHPTILYLHLARLHILTPVLSIQTLAESWASKSSTTRLDPEDNYSYDILQWANRDQHKARLSIIHAGAIFWHLRRYGTDCFTEPFAIYISTLAIWAYSIATRSAFVRNDYSRHDASSRIPPGEQTAADNIDEDEDSEMEITSITIDRPCDDESVQVYVRMEHKVIGNMARVGDICAKEAPRKILREGIRLMRTACGINQSPRSGKDNSGSQGTSTGGTSGMEQSTRSTWGIVDAYIRLLQKLLDNTR